ncbi:hypothetical protein LDENG_00266300 [Lucifuga dentata]|nr:hypothetical protein LDENG_00266300 [Lucifuga dentata]
MAAHRVNNIQQPLMQKDRTSSLDQKEPEPPHIKEEQEELWTSREGEQRQGLEEADGTKFPFALVHMKSENDEDKVKPSHLHQSRAEESAASSSSEQMKPEADGDDRGGPEAARNLDPDIKQVLVQQEWRPSLEQEEPEHLHIKEEEDWTSQEGEEQQDLAEPTASSSTEQTKAAVGEDCEETYKVCLYNN